LKNDPCGFKSAFYDIKRCVARFSRTAFELPHGHDADMGRVRKLLLRPLEKGATCAALGRGDQFVILSEA
jgi:hypothetical protein